MKMTSRLMTIPYCFKPLKKVREPLKRKNVDALSQKNLFLLNQSFKGLRFKNIIPSIIYSFRYYYCKINNDSVYKTIN